MTDSAEYTYAPTVPLVLLPELEIKELPKVKYVEQASLDVLCSCYRYVKETYYPDLPGTDYILANLQQEYADVAVFYYPDSGLYHYAKIIEKTTTTYILDESNYQHCKQGIREIPHNYPRLIGFFDVI